MWKNSVKQRTKKGIGNDWILEVEKMEEGNDTDMM